MSLTLGEKPQHQHPPQAPSSPEPLDPLTSADVSVTSIAANANNPGHTHVHAALVSDLRFNSIYALSALVALWISSPAALGAVNSAVESWLSSGSKGNTTAFHPVVLSNLYIGAAYGLSAAARRLRGVGVRAALRALDKRERGQERGGLSPESRARRVYLASLVVGACVPGLAVNATAQFFAGLGPWIRFFGTAYVVMELAMRACMAISTMGLGGRGIRLPEEKEEHGTTLMLAKRLLVAQLGGIVLATPAAALIALLAPAPVGCAWRGGLFVIPLQFEPWVPALWGITAAILVAMAGVLVAELLWDVDALVALSPDQVLLSSLVRPRSERYSGLLLQRGLDISRGERGICRDSTTAPHDASDDSSEKDSLPPLSFSTAAPEDDLTWLENYYLSNLKRTTMQLVVFWFVIRYSAGGLHNIPIPFFLPVLLGLWWDRAQATWPSRIQFDIYSALMLVYCVDFAGAFLDQLQNYNLMAGAGWADVWGVKRNLINALFIYKITRFGISYTLSIRCPLSARVRGTLGAVSFALLGTLGARMRLLPIVFPLMNWSTSKQATAADMAFAAGMTVYAALTPALLLWVGQMCCAALRLSTDEELETELRQDGQNGAELPRVASALGLEMPPSKKACV